MESKPNIYVYNLLKSAGVKFDQDESFIISRILSLSNTNSLQKVPLVEISQKLLKIFEMGHTGTWSKVDRICFVARDSYSNQLRLLSSSHNEKVLDSILVPGYSCLIDEKSSLFNIKPGEIRVYENIENIISAYKISNKQVQRSLGLIYKSNLKSGITLPLMVDDRILGFLFFNSVTPGAFNNLAPQDFSLLCLLQLVYETLLSKYIFERMELNTILSLELVENKNQLSHANLKKDLEKLAYMTLHKEIDFNVQIDIKTDFLMSYRKYIQTILNILLNIKNIHSFSVISLALVSCKENRLMTEITLDGGTKIELESNIRKINIMDDVEFRIEKNRIYFTHKYELITDGALYSV